MNIFLQELSKRYPNEFLCVFWDGAPCHSKRKLNVPDNIMLQNIPPYSPDLNPSENMWDEIKEGYFHNIVFDSIEAVKDKLIEAAEFYEKSKDTVKSIVGWEWIISAL